MFSAAFSTSETMSPMPRMRLATRCGWNSSSASTFSPVPTSLIGLPVTARIDSAAPPRASPSMRVSDEKHLVRTGRRLDLRDLGHQRLVDGDPAGGVEHDHVEAAEPRRLDR